MSAGYALRPKADRDLDEILDDFFERASPEVALRFLAAAHDAFGLVATQPEMGWPCRLSHRDLAEARVFRIGKPFEKYLFFYLPWRQQIQILRILHGAQDLEARLGLE